MAVLRPREGGLRWGEIFWLRVTTASAQCLRLSEHFFRLTLQLLEECTEKLRLAKAARRLFLEDGQEVLDEEDLDREVEVYVSTGESFKNPVKDLLSTIQFSLMSSCL